MGKSYRYDPDGDETLDRKALKRLRKEQRRFRQEQRDLIPAETCDEEPFDVMSTIPLDYAD